MMEGLDVEIRVDLLLLALDDGVQIVRAQARRDALLFDDVDRLRYDVDLALGE
jgi:hypothetical protein